MVPCLCQVTVTAPPLPRQTGCLQECHEPLNSHSPITLQVIEGSYLLRFVPMSLPLSVWVPGLLLMDSRLHTVLLLTAAMFSQPNCGMCCLLSLMSLPARTMRLVYCASPNSVIANPCLNQITCLPLNHSWHFLLPIGQGTSPAQQLIPGLPGSHSGIHSMVPPSSMANCCVQLVREC